MPTLAPGCHFVPHWRTMMLPATTRSPPNFFTPRYCGLLSRPFREEPTPFLCAICPPRSAEGDVVDLHFREGLPVPLLAGVVLPALHLEDDDLVALTMPNDLTGDLCATQRRHTGAYVAAVVSEEDFVELDLRTLVTDQRRNSIRSTRLDTELLAAGLDDRVRHKRGSCDLVRRT